MPTSKTAVLRSARSRKLVSGNTNTTARPKQKSAAPARASRRAKARTPQTKHLQLPLTADAREIYELYKACSAAQWAVWQSTPEARKAAQELLWSQQGEFQQKALKIVGRIVPKDPKELQNGIAPGDLITLFLLKSFGVGHLGTELRSDVSYGFHSALFGAAGIKSEERIEYRHSFPDERP